MIQRAHHRRAINLEHGVRWELLVPVPEPDVEFMEVQFAVGGGNTTDHSTRHNGREYALVLEGTLAINVGFEQYVLEAGDSLAFDSSIPHRIFNAGAVPVRAVWLVLGRMLLQPGLPSPETLHTLGT
jgi:mannose-6-phosphate isomerase-like protein (cupin superfamily)